MIENFSKEELNNEQWKDIFGYDGVYQVSDLGRVRSKKYGYWRVMNPRNVNGGYLKVDLCKDGKRKPFLVHRLVASAFIENDNIFNTEVNHIDECKQNNRVSNLEYCDRSYNLSYNGLRNRRHYPQPKRSKLKDLYDPNLTYKQNVELFKSKGIDCSTMVVKSIRRDLGLINP